MSVLVSLCALVLLAASLQHVASLSLSATLLSPSTALLQWSSATSVAPLSLSAPFLPSALSLSSSIAAAGHLLLTDVTITDATEITLLSSSAISDAQESLESADSVHASLFPSLPGGPRAWDLSGARLLPAVDCADPSCSSHRVRWTGPSAASDLHAPPLLYSVFVEWSAHTISARDPHDAANDEYDATRPDQPTRQPTIGRHTIRMCTMQGRSKQHQQAPIQREMRAEERRHTEEILYCDMDAQRLPRGVELTLHLLTECDYQRIDVESAVRLPYCLSAVSPVVRVTLASMLAAVSLAAALPPVSIAAAPGVTQLSNDTAVREALCAFYNQTSGPRWRRRTGWCNPAVPICSTGTQHGWFGVSCDSTGTVVTSLNLRSNGLVSVGAVDISPLFTVVNQLENLVLSGNAGLLLSRLDLTPLSQLTSLTLSGMLSVSVPGVPFQPLLLPYPQCRLQVLNMQQTGFAMQQWSACTALSTLDLSVAQAPMPLAIIASFPQLQQFFAPYSALTGEVGGQLSALYILAHLNESNPQLTALDLSGCAGLPFGLANATDNLPRISSPSLTTLKLSDLPLRTGSSGPADLRWLADMLSLCELELLTLPNVIMDTAVFHFASRSLASLACDSPTLGDLSPLLPLHSLAILTLSGTALRSQLPSNISAVWPHLNQIACSACLLFGELPDFRGLPALTQVRHALAAATSAGASPAHASSVSHCLLVCCECRSLWIAILSSARSVWSSPQTPLSSRLCCCPRICFKVPFPRSVALPR